MDITNLTKTIGDTIAKIKNNNKLVDELNKAFNPTFVEIMENLQETDPTLAKMLMVWYLDTYSLDKNKLNKLVANYQDKKKTQSKPFVLESGCGNTSGIYGGGCSDSDSGFQWRRNRSSSGCGSSSSSGGC